MHCAQLIDRVTKATFKNCEWGQTLMLPQLCSFYLCNVVKKTRTKYLDDNIPSTEPWVNATHRFGKEKKHNRWRTRDKKVSNKLDTSIYHQSVDNLARRNQTNHDKNKHKTICQRWWPCHSFKEPSREKMFFEISDDECYLQTWQWLEIDSNIMFLKQYNQVLFTWY